MVNRNCLPRTEGGYTLTEIMMVVAIMGVVMAFGVPGMRDLLANQRMKTAAFNLIASVMNARGEAVKRSMPIYIAAPSANNLSNGWCTMVSSSAVCSVNAPGVETMRVQQPVSGVTYVFRTTPGLITFNRSGRLSNRVMIEIVDAASSSLTRCVTIDVAGHARSKMGDCS